MKRFRLVITLLCLIACTCVQGYARDEAFMEGLKKAVAGYEALQEWDTNNTQGMDQLAEQYISESIRIFTNLYERGERTDSTIITQIYFCSYMMGELYKKKRMYHACLEYYEMSLAWGKLIGKKSESAELHNIGVIYAYIGDYITAERYFQQSVANGVKGFQEPEVYYDVLRSLACNYQTLGKYKEAEEEYEKCYNHFKNVEKGKNVEKCLTLFNDLALLSIAQGNYSKAKQWLDEMLTTLKHTYQEPYSQYSLCYGNIAQILLHEKDYQSTINMLHRALINVVGEDEQDNLVSKAAIYNNLSICYSEQNKQDSAIAYARKSGDLYRLVYTENHPKYAISKSCEAYAYLKKKMYQEAILHYKDVVSIMEQTTGDDSPTTMISTYNLASAYVEMADYHHAEPLLKRVTEIAKLTYKQALEYMSERQRALYWTQIREILDQPEMAKYIIRAYKTIPSVSGFAYDKELFGKGLLLASTDMVRRAILQSGDEFLIKKYDYLVRLKISLTQMESIGASSEEIAVQKQQIEMLEKEVTKHSAAFRQNEELWRIDWKQVQQHLRSNEVAVEFSRIAFDDSVVYAALLLRKDSPYPKILPLFEENEINAQADNIWQKMTPYLKGISTIYFAASGGLHQLPIEYASYDANSTWADHYDMVRLSSTRELAIPHEEQQVNSATLFGGIFYDVDIAELSAQSEDYSSLNMAVSRSMDINDSTLRAGVRYLPGTKREVEEINAILQPLHIRTKLYTASVANEESFKALSGQKQDIIHIATHGFYWSDTVAQQQRYFTNRAVSISLDQMNEAPAIDPLNRSGLLFAGANLALRGHSDELPENVQDGILTAKEISLLDLRNAQLVVLSACETGKGDITGDGVFGLQRAFKQAGAQTLLMSLWPVSDAATQLLMEQFYYHRMEKKESKREAFRNAQNVVRNKYPQPKYWAGFIMLD